MSKYAYYNGQFDKAERIKIPLSDRTIFFGDCVYDAAVGCYDRILWEEEHVDRLLDNAKRLSIKHKYTKHKLSQLLREMAVKSGIESYFLYFSLSRNAKKRNHSAVGCDESNLLVTIEPITVNQESKPLRLITAEDKRYGYCDIKTVNLLPAVLALTDAENKGCDEVIFHRNGIVTECAKSNISIIIQGRVKTHPKSSSILPGITRGHLLTAAESINIPCEETEFTVEEMLCADEILITSTSKLCRKVEMIDGVKVGGKSPCLADQICRLIYSEYDEFCKLKSQNLKN